MVSVAWALIAFCIGLLGYILVAALAPSLSLSAQLRIGRFHYKSAMRAWGQVAIVWRTLGGPELKPLRVDDEQKLAQITLSSGTLSDDQELPFNDPDSRLYRLHKKPLAVVPELLPAAVDAELAEVGHWVKEKGKTQGFEPGEDAADPFVPMSDQLRAVHPLDAIHVAAKSVEPEFVKTAKQMTEARYQKYGGRVGAAETMATVTAFAVGAGAVVGIVYVRDEIIGSSTTPDGSVTLPPGSLVEPDLLFQALQVLPL